MRDTEHTMARSAVVRGGVSGAKRRTSARMACSLADRARYSMQPLERTTRTAPSACSTSEQPTPSEHPSPQTHAHDGDSTHSGASDRHSPVVMSPPSGLGFPFWRNRQSVLSLHSSEAASQELLHGALQPDRTIGSASGATTRALMRRGRALTDRHRDIRHRRTCRGRRLPGWRSAGRYRRGPLAEPERCTRQ